MGRYQGSADHVEGDYEYDLNSLALGNLGNKLL